VLVGNVDGAFDEFAVLEFRAGRDTDSRRTPDSAEFDDSIAVALSWIIVWLPSWR
jgi:hypothetical protein